MAGGQCVAIPMNLPIAVWSAFDFRIGEDLWRVLGLSSDGMAADACGGIRRNTTFARVTRSISHDRLTRVRRRLKGGPDATMMSDCRRFRPITSAGGKYDFQPLLRILDFLSSTGPRSTGAQRPGQEGGRAVVNNVLPC